MIKHPESKSILRKELKGESYCVQNTFTQLIEQTDRICTAYRHLLNTDVPPYPFPRESSEYHRRKKIQLSFMLANERVSKEDAEKIKSLNAALNCAPEILSYIEDDELAIEKIKSICELWLDSIARPKKQGVSRDPQKGRSLLRNECFILLCMTFYKFVPEATLGCGSNSPFMRYIRACYRSQGCSESIATIKSRVSPSVSRYNEALKTGDSAPFNRLFTAFFGPC